MATIERFEDLIAWQKARALTKTIYRCTGTGNFARDFGLRDQIRRASVSVLSNIAEGFERRSDATLKHYLDIAAGSCGEVRAQLYVALDAEYIDSATFGQLRESAEEVSRLIRAFHRSIKPIPIPTQSATSNGN